MVLVLLVQFFYFYLVSEFSKKTGDYHSLSPVDLKVIALTYQLQRETGPEGGANLNADPVKPKVNVMYHVIVFIT